MKFSVQGTSGRIYLTLVTPPTQPSCDCPDFKFNKKKLGVCKHTLFILRKVLRLSDNQWSDVNNLETLERILTERIPHLTNEFAEEDLRLEFSRFSLGTSENVKQVEERKLELKNTECGICLCDFETGHTSSPVADVIICPVCMNGVHADCWKHWSQANLQRKERLAHCIYCRGIIRPKHQLGRSFHFEKDEWGLWVQ